MSSRSLRGPLPQELDQPQSSDTKLRRGDDALAGDLPARCPQVVARDEREVELARLLTAKPDVEGTLERPSTERAYFTKSRWLTYFSHTDPVAVAPLGPARTYDVVPSLKPDIHALMYVSHSVFCAGSSTSLPEPLDEL